MIGMGKVPYLLGIQSVPSILPMSEVALTLTTLKTFLLNIQDHKKMHDTSGSLSECLLRYTRKTQTL